MLLLRITQNPSVFNEMENTAQNTDVTPSSETTSASVAAQLGLTSTGVSVAV